MEVTLSDDWGDGPTHAWDPDLTVTANFDVPATTPITPTPHTVTLQATIEGSDILTGQEFVNTGQ